MLFQAPVLHKWGCGAQGVDGWGYKTYFYESDSGANALVTGPRARGSISVRLSANMLEGSTGCYQWEAGFLLGSFILSRPHLFAGEFLMSSPEVSSSS